MIKELRKAIAAKRITTRAISERYNVSERTVRRWLTEEVNPKLEIQYELFRLIDNDQIENIANDLVDSESKLKTQVDSMLCGLRDSFYRWGKYSTRNEALEELSKLILAQISLVKFQQVGIHQFKNCTGAKNAEAIIGTLNAALKRILGSNADSSFLHADYRLAIKPSQSALLAEICSAFRRIDWTDIASLEKLDLFNEIFGRFLANSFVDEKEMGQYLTPIEMTRFIVGLAIQNLTKLELALLTDPDKCKDFGYILDPSCGAGSFLVELIHQLMPRVINTHGHEKARKWLKNMGKYVLFGIDKSNRMFRLTIFSFSAMGIPCTNVYSLNSLATNQNREILEAKLGGKVRIILTNPPFGAEFSGNELGNYKLYNSWAARVPRKIDSELLFLERYIDWLTQDGYCLSVVPDSVLTNRGLFQDLRKGIQPQIELKAVISFPPETFSAAGTSTKTSVLNFVKRSGTRPQLAYFGICKNIGFKVITKGSNRVKVTTAESDLEGILNEIVSQTDDQHFGRKILFDDSFYRWDANYHASLTSHEDKLLQSVVEFDVRLSDVAELMNDRLDPRRAFKEFTYIEISDILPSGIAESKRVKAIDAPSRARKRVKFRDVLASTVRPEQRKIGYVINDQDADLICTTGLAVLRPRGIEPGVLVELLKTEFVTKQLLRNNIGIAYPAVEEGCFPNILLPINRVELAELNQRAKEIEDLKINLIKLEKAYKVGIVDLTEKWLNERAVS